MSAATRRSGTKWPMPWARLAAGLSPESSSSHCGGDGRINEIRYLDRGQTMSIFQEFKTFAMRGNAIDLAVGIVVGAAFTSIVNSLVKDLINPPLGLLLGGIDFSNFFVVLKSAGTYPTFKAAQEAGAVTLSYWLFLNSV